MVVWELAWPSPRATWLGEDDLEFRLGKNETLKRNSQSTAEEQFVNVIARHLAKNPLDRVYVESARLNYSLHAGKHHDD